MNTSTIATYVAIALLIAAVGILVTVLERRRDKALQAFASEVGFSPVNEISLELLPGGGPVGSAMEGTISRRRVVLFDWVCRTGHGRHRKTHVTTVAAFAAPDTLPKFELEKKSLLTIGERHIAFQDDPAFSTKLLVSGPDENAIRQLFNPQLRDVLVSELAEKKFRIEGRGDWILIYQRYKRVSGTKYRGFFKDASQIVDRLMEGVPARKADGAA
jgi:hypothetical protein